MIKHQSTYLFQVLLCTFFLGCLLVGGIAEQLCVLDSDNIEWIESSENDSEESKIEVEKEFEMDDYTHLTIPQFYHEIRFCYLDVLQSRKESRTHSEVLVPPPELS